MRYVSALTDPEVRAELMADLSGLAVGSAFLVNSPQQAERWLKLCDDAAQKAYEGVRESGRPAEVECITIEVGSVVGFDSLRTRNELPENPIVTQVYRYFDTPREAIVEACIAAPSEIKKTRKITFFCGPDRRKTGDYRIFSLHPGAKRQPFPNRYQPEAVRKDNRNYWDRHVFMATPNQILAAKRMMKERYAELEPEARDRAFHMMRHMDAALHRWYGTWENMKHPDDVKSILEGLQTHGDYEMGPDGCVYYYITAIKEPPPDLSKPEVVEPRLSNPTRPCIIRPDGGEEYFFEGKRHRVGGPGLIRPEPDGGWLELWYEEGLISRLPEEGPAKIVYGPNGDIVQEVAIYRGAEVEETTLGEAAAPVKALQEQIVTIGQHFKWFEESPSFQLLRGQIDFAAARTKLPADKIVRQMQPKDEQVGLRWDFDHTLEQDERDRKAYDEMVLALKVLDDKLIAAAQAMRFVRGDAGIINAIWGKVQRDLDRLTERGVRIPGEPGKTVVDTFMEARDEAKKYFQSLADQSKTFSATGR